MKTTWKTSERTKAALRKKAKAMLADIFYQTLRRDYGAKDSYETVKLYDAFTTALAATKPGNRRDCATDRKENA